MCNHIFEVSPFLFDRKLPIFCHRLQSSDCAVCCTAPGYLCSVICSAGVAAAGKSKCQTWLDFKGHLKKSPSLD